MNNSYPRIYLYTIRGSTYVAYDPPAHLTLVRVHPHPQTAAHAVGTVYFVRGRGWLARTAPEEADALLGWELPFTFATRSLAAATLTRYALIDAERNRLRALTEATNP